MTAVYENIADEVMVNIARHFNTGRNLPTVEWQMQKLLELGQLTRENMAIIANMTGQASEMTALALENAALTTINSMEPTLARAAYEGYVQNAAEDVMSARVRSVLTAYQNQALDKLNLVNTTMLQSSADAYRKVISDTLLWEQQEARLGAAQSILNSSTGEVITGASSRTTALRKALKQMSDAGLTGFVDRAGRRWTPEAYINMDIRTTCGNVANEAAIARNQDYGNDLMWIPILAAARPLCYPYQGWVVSTTNRSGTTLDLDNREVQIHPLNSTSYGKPAGIGGINCHHVPFNIFVPGFSMVRGTVPPEEENDRLYAESQEQRRLERELRKAKREAAMADAAGDKELFDDRALRVKRTQADLNEFVSKTGRTKRVDRAQVSGYNRGVAGKVTQGAKRQEVIKQKAAAAKEARETYIREIKPTLVKNTAPLPDEVLQSTLSVNIKTKGGYYLHSIAPQGVAFTNVRIIAGYGVRDNFRNASKFAETFGGEDYKWKKVGGLIKTDNFVYDVHWYQYDGNARHYIYELKRVTEKK